MSGLKLFLLGPPRLESGGEPVHIGRTKAVALLAYLAVTGRSHSREALITLLSPEFDTARARRELRRTLCVLNSLLGQGYLEVDRERVSLNPNPDPPTPAERALWLDVDQFRQRLAACEAHDHPSDEACPDCAPLLEEAVDLYQDGFLAGFTLPDSLEFEEWQFFQAEELRQALGNTLQRLVGWHGEQGGQGNEQAIAYARRWLALDPLHEPAHRQLMELYAQAGRRGAALRQYRICLRALEEELGIAAAPETTELYERLRAARARPPTREVTPPPRAEVRAVELPVFLAAEKARAEEKREVFVARERELTQLDAYLTNALGGQGQVVFLTGGPGRGKTALMNEFARRATDALPDLLVAVGNCNAYSGVGDPYLPLRQVIQMLTGDVEARWTAGTVTGEQARRLWAALPEAIRALLDHSAPLIDIFLPGASLLSRGEAAIVSAGQAQATEEAGWLEQLREAIQREKGDSGQLAQSQLFEGYTHMLGALAVRHPLLLILDDLQWADSASVGLLFHLGREMASKRILLVGAYRPEEVALGRPSTSAEGVERHPLEKVLTEFKRNFGDVWLDLSRADEIEERRFVDTFLDTEPHRLGDDFRRALFRTTGGHPLFTVELLREMQARGHLVRDEQGRWTEGGALDWETLPARVEGVIEERLGRLGERLQEILRLASVEGEEFTAQVVSRLGDIPERELLRALSQELGARHRLVREGGEVQIAGSGRFLARYRFTHALFQGYLYHALSAGERRLLHGEVAEALEELYAGVSEEVIVQLAHHYSEAGRGEKAVDYLLRAGDQARLAYAHEEAINHYRRALAFQKARGDYDRAAHTLMKLALVYHTAFDFRAARQTYEEGFALWRRAGDMQRVQVIPPPPAPHALRMTWRSPATLDPTLASDDASTLLLAQLFSGLVQQTRALDVGPDVAQTWEVSEGGCQYVFRLRDDVRWSDGTPLTAADFEFAWKRILDPATRSLNASLLYDVRGARAFHQGETSEPNQVGVHAADDATLVVDLESPTGYFLQLLTMPATFPVPQHVVEAHGEAWTELGNIVTNGPFALEVSQSGERILLARNPMYHGRFAGNLQRVELATPADEHSSGILGLYEADKLDILSFTALSVPEKDRARQRHPGELIWVPELSTKGVWFDASRLPFDDLRVRRAFVLATDREALADVIIRGYGFPATGGLVPPGMPGHSMGIGLPYDPDQARRLLAEAGYPGGRSFPRVHAATWHQWEPISEYLQAQWRDNLGVEIRWEITDWLTYLDRTHREPPHMDLGGWIADYPDPDSFLRVAYRYFKVELRNETYDRLVEEARRLTDQRKRMTLYRQADAILVAEAAIMPLFHTRSDFLIKPWVRHVYMSSIVLWNLKDAIIEPH